MRKRIISLLLLLVTVVSLGSQFTAGAVFNVDYEPYCPSVLLVNTDTGVTIFEKGADDKRYPASTTKVMTALLALELCPDVGTMITVPDEVMEDLEGTDSSRSGLKSRERISLLDLLYCLLLPSGNDAALTIAYEFGDGDPDNFVRLMNERAQELGCKNTHFANPHGLHDDDHYTTARDLAKICTKAMELPVFSTIVSTRLHYIEETNKNAKRYVLNTNYLLDVNYSTTYYYTYCKGIKTGRTNKAGNCFCAYATRNGYNFICICLNAPLYDQYGKKLKYNYSFIDAKELFDWAFTTLTLKEVLAADEVIAEVPVDLAWNRDALSLLPEESFKTLLPNAVTSTSVYRQVNIPESIEAPITKGDVIGTVTLVYAYEEIGTINLVASESVERSELLYILSIINDIFQSTAFKIILALLLIGIVAYVVWAMMFRRGSSKSKKVRRYRRM